MRRGKWKWWLIGDRRRVTSDERPRLTWWGFNGKGILVRYGV